MEAASGPTQPPWLPPSRATRVGSTPSWAARQPTAASASDARSWRLWSRQSPPEEPQPGLSQPRPAKPALASASASSSKLSRSAGPDPSTNATAGWGPSPAGRRTTPASRVPLVLEPYLEAQRADILEGRDAASPATATRGRPWSGWRRRPAARGARSSTTSRPSWTCSWPCWSRTPSMRPLAGRPARSPTPSPAWPPRTPTGPPWWSSSPAAAAPTPPSATAGPAAPPWSATPSAPWSTTNAPPAGSPPPSPTRSPPASSASSATASSSNEPSSARSPTPTR